MPTNMHRNEQRQEHGIHTHIYMYIYIYIERERERERRERERERYLFITYSAKTRYGLARTLHMHNEHPSGCNSASGVHKIKTMLNCV